MASYAVVCASAFATEDFATRVATGAFERVIAVDSGLVYVQEAGVIPDVILGDFDSLGFVPEGALVHPAIKDKSDLELALDYALEQGATDIIVYGCLGGRMDHTLAALQNLAFVAERGVRVRAVDVTSGDKGSANERRPRAVILEPMSGPCRLSLGVGKDLAPEIVPDLGAPTYGSVSVFAATDCAHGVREQGMYYPLSGVTLTNRTSLGLSNELVERGGHVEVEDGTLFVLYPADVDADLVRL